MRPTRRFHLPAAFFGVALALTACGVTGSDAGTDATAADPGTSAEAEPLADKRIMVPNSAGGGYDQTARTAAQVMEANELSTGLEVFNLEGAGGTVGLARTVSEAGNGDLAMLMGLGVVGASYTNESEATLTETTPLAKLIEEPGAIMVPADSPYETIDDLVEAWTADPGGLSVGGGSNPGGPDHLLPMQLAQAVGIDPTTVNFVTYDGGGDLLPAILGSKLDFATSGAGEFKDQIETGEIRVLAVSSEEPVEGVDAPTLTESGIDLVFTNWRGLVAPPDIEDADRDAWIAALEAMHATEDWQEALETNGWTDAFITGDEYAEFLTEQDERVANVLEELGLA
ncbi:Bug family tripartite tricarboxylate transporter substrate binding protein [Georgenia subflava]|uniref:Tripartite tricarboxylate transporter substrate binding protein n=1 Tax=Georgenia subflava TaxID=1622177 RepID=A0A6N7EDU5_9MICO|nr:tripartite tricarboxylate transporter substrate-binding protein [Georgenia subflava]MPV35511.1 tripartite tricarboxylate transporter substrate binding protein [Georgenia subflava]